MSLGFSTVRVFVCLSEYSKNSSPFVACRSFTPPPTHIAMFLTTTKPEMDCVSEPKCMSKASGVDFPNKSLSWSSLTSSSMRGTEALGFPPLPFFFRSFFFFTLRPFLLFQTRCLLLRCSLNFFSSNTFQSWLTYHAMNGLIILVFLSHCYNEWFEFVLGNFFYSSWLAF